MADIQQVQWRAPTEVSEAPKITEEEEAALRHRMAVMDKILATKGLAKYKIEVVFGSERGSMKPTSGMISFWESGTKFHGGGDTKIYLCPAKDLKKSDCEGFIPDAANGFGFLVCPKCREVWQGEQVHGEIFAKLTMQNWATLLLRYFVKLELNCDLYVKSPKLKLREVALQEQERQHGGEKLAKVRAQRETYIYPLRNIIKDTSNGAALYDRFYAFLKA